MSTSIGRQSMAASDEDIIQIYEQCVKLSVNNKINPSNAFSLRLIDYMPLLAKPKPGQLVDFKVVSSALLAASKIYRCRVKHVYDEAHRIAAYLNIALIKDKDGKGGRPLDGSGDHDDEEGANEESGNRAKKRKIARKTVKTIANNLDTISINSVECIVPPDPLFAQLSATFDIGSVKGLLTTNLNHQAGTGLLMLTGTKFTIDPDDFSEYFDKNQQALVNELKTITESKSQLVPALAKFEFLVRDADANVSLSTMRNASDTMDRLTPFEEYHINDTVVNSPACSDLVDDAVMSDRGSEAGDQPQENTMVENVNHTQNLVKLDAESASDYLLKMLTVDEQSDYTTPFHKPLEGAWAGPQFVKPCVNRKKSQTPARSAKKSRAHFEEIDFSQPPPEKETTDANTVLKFATLNKWPERLLPIDISYDPMSLLKPFLKENATFSALKVIGPDTAANCHAEDAEANSLDGRDSPVDAGLDHHDSYDEYDNFPPASQFPPQGFSQDPGGGTNPSDDDLIAEPFKISSTHLPYPKVAKRIDIIKLKKEMWSMVNIEGCENLSPTVQKEFSVEETETESMEANSDTNVTPEKCLPFSDLYKKLPDKVGNVMAKNLSVPIAFVALLHLTNEKNLMLESRSDLSDFIIKAPPDN